jgi:hypothetical protein
VAQQAGAAAQRTAQGFPPAILVHTEQAAAFLLPAVFPAVLLTAISYNGKRSTQAE